MKGSFRDLASFGKRMEYSVIAEMLEDGLDVYVPLVDDRGIDAVVRLEDGRHIDVQIKARSGRVNRGDEALFAGVRYYDRPNYYYVFRADGMRDDNGKPMTWVLSSEEFYRMSYSEKKGEETLTRCIKFNRSGKWHLSENEKFSVFRVARVADVLGNV